jgi:hypothetical protein
MTQTLQATPAATITVTHTIVVLRGDIASDVTVHYARTTDTRIGLAFGTTLMNFYSAAPVQGLLEAFTTAQTAMARIPRQLNVSATPPYEPFARTTLAIEWTRRPAYCVVPQSGPSQHNGATTHWLDIYCGPVTFQIRDQLGLKSTTAILARTHKTAVAVFLDGPQHADDFAAEHYQGPDQWLPTRAPRSRPRTRQ